MRRLVAFDDNALRVQPQKTPRMPAYPYLLDPSPQQVNISTLYKLCGEIPPEFAVRQDDPVAHLPHTTVQAAPPTRMNDSKKPKRVGNNEMPRSQGMDHHSDVDTPSYVSAPVDHPLAKIPDCQNPGDPASFRPRQPRVQASPYTDDGEDKPQSLYNPLSGVIDIHLTEWQEFSSREAGVSGGGYSNISTIHLIDRLPQEQEEQWQLATLTGKVRNSASPPSVLASHFSISSSLGDPAEGQDPEEPQNYYRNCSHHSEVSSMAVITSCFLISDIDSDADEHHHANPQAPPTSHFSLSDMSDIGLDADKEDEEERNAVAWRLSDLLAPTTDDDDDDDNDDDDDDVLRLPEPLPGSIRPASPWRYSNSEGSISPRMAGGNVLSEMVEDDGWI
ncbi:hypothetical protein MMYC01_210118 [Madurella mycetomatis]|uniref:Uncharacterized protein n=1 Tax=Madurella mycetomatis TaxID=100816 RepID=A0A175VR19_9PEZI|nr:hypothetical protein MMYC01_210118 [Madurella mycetomatis]